MTRWPVVLLGLVALCCDSGPTRISVSPDSAATARDGVVITIRSFDGEGFSPSHAIRFGGRELPTDLRSDGSLSATLSRADLRMTPADPQSKEVQVAIVEAGVVVSDPAVFRVRKAFRFASPSTIAAAGSYPGAPLERCAIQRAGLHTLLVSWVSSSSSPSLWGMRSDDDGRSWSQPTRLYELGPGPAHFLGVGPPESLSLIVLRDAQLLAVTSLDLGATWASPVVIAQGATSFAARMDPRGFLDLAWMESRGERRHIRYSRSGDFGATWTFPEWVAEDRNLGWVDGVVGDAVGRVLLCEEYDYGRYGGGQCYRKVSGAQDWRENGHGPTSDSSTIVLDDGTLLMAGRSMYLPYKYSSYVSSTVDWGTTWSSFSFFDEYGEGQLEAFMYGGADSFNAVIGSAGGRDVVRSHDRGATWGDASTLSVRPISYATTSDGAVLGVGGSGTQGIWMVRGD